MANENRIIDKLVEAFKTVTNDSIFKPLQYVIDNEQMPWFGLTVLSVLAPLPEALGSATNGYIYCPDDRKAEK